MSERVQELTPTTAVRAIEANLFEFYRLVAAETHAEFYDGPELLWMITDIPFFLFNSTLRAHLSPDTADAEIEAAIARCVSRNVPMLWWTGPATQPANLGAFLMTHGFLHIDDVPGMAVDLQELNERLSTTHDVTVELVRNADALQTWCQVAAIGFEMPDFVASAFADFFTNVGFDQQMLLRNYIAWHQDKPVATTSLFLGAGVAGIYNVATVPDARRQGIGARITATALQDARALGYRVGILHASAMGVGIYRQLGFQEYCTIGQYIWAAESEGNEAE